jgi:pantoate--beta-alanine ligase
MKIIESASEARAYFAKIRKKGQTIGFVPTLGGLHKGHQLLMERAGQENNVVVLSIFLNPMQFRKKQYFAYPSDFEQDVFVAKKMNVEVIFHPSVAEMFTKVQALDEIFQFQTETVERRDSENFVIDESHGIDNLIRVPSNLVYCLDGKLHPWVFDGSTTIVCRFFDILQPDKAYFGEKDIQQLTILTKMAAVYFPEIEIIGVPTLRETDGLAFSSRNVLLSEKERRTALGVYEAMKSGEQQIRQGEYNSKIVLNGVIEFIQTLKPVVEIDYIDIVDKSSLAPVEQIQNDVILYVAFFLNGIRLTDTLIISLC